MLAINWSRFSSASRISWLKKTMMPSVSSARTMGKANALCSPAFVVNGVRRKLLSTVRSEIQAGLPLFHTRPGRPEPGEKLNSQLADANAARSSDGECQISQQVRRLVWGSTRHISANFQSRHSQID